MTELLLGILCGLAISLFFSFGPAFFKLIQNSLHLGFRRAVPFAFGVSLGDIIIVSLTLTVLRRFDMWELLHNVYVASVAAAVIAAIGVYTFRKKAAAPDGSQPMPRIRNVFFSAFLLNIVNPSIWLYWISIIAIISGEFDVPTSQMYIFFAGVLMTTLSMDVLKCRLASLLHNVITPKVINVFNRITGIILTGFALFLLVSMVVYQVDPSARDRERQEPSPSTQVIKRIHEGAGLQSHTKNVTDTVSVN
ncbi:MAG: LysE family transporter [Bacteroidales bacterium]|nr:LysE family transporter [Bacteroidales bacterium]